MRVDLLAQAIWRRSISAAERPGAIARSPSMETMRSPRWSVPVAAPWATTWSTTRSFFGTPLTTKSAKMSRKAMRKFMAGPARDDDDPLPHRLAEVGPRSDLRRVSSSLGVIPVIFT